MAFSRAFLLAGLTLLAADVLGAAPTKSTAPPKKSAAKPKSLAPFDLSTLPAPAPLAVPTPTLVPTPTSAPLPEFPAPLPPSIEQKRAQLPQGGVLPPEIPSQPPVPIRANPAPAPNQTQPDTTEAPATAPVAPKAALSSGDWNAALNIAGLPARVNPNQKLTVVFWALNRGSIAWQTGSNGANRVRIVARWVDASTQKRRKWNFFWLQSPLAPNAQARRNFELAAPPQAGRYYVVFGLIQLPASGEYSPPTYGAAQAVWPDEFANAAFQVEVTP